MNKLHNLLAIYCAVAFCSSVAAEKNISKKMTQSEAHMSIPTIAAQVNTTYNVDKNAYYQKLYDEVVQKEKQFSDTHYVFYSAFTNEWLVPQDLYLKLYMRFHPLSINYKNGIQNFRMFRWIPVTHQTPKEFLKSEMLNTGLVNDRESRLRAYLLSANLALFGNVGFPLECSFDYYINSVTNTKVSNSIFRAILDIFDLPNSYKKGEKPVSYRFLKEVDALNDLLEVVPVEDKTPGTLSQIFIPKQSVDSVAYLAWIKGVPFDEKLINWIITHSGKNIGRPIEKMQEIRTLFKDVPSSHPLFQKILDGIEEGKYNISSALEEYIATPELVPGLNTLQARLILSPEYTGNPSSNVKIFTYDRLNREKKKLYEQKLDEIADKIFAAILKHNAQVSPAYEQPKNEEKTLQKIAPIPIKQKAVPTPVQQNKPSSPAKMRR